MLLPILGRAILLSFTISFSGPWVKATDCPFFQERFSKPAATSLNSQTQPVLLYFQNGVLRPKLIGHGLLGARVIDPLTIHEEPVLILSGLQRN